MRKVLFIAALLASWLPFVSTYAQNVAKIGSVEYETLQAAVDDAYDNMSGPDSPDPAGREAQIDAVETTVKEAAPKIAEEAYDIMTGEKATTENPSTMGEQKPIIESEELENTGTDNN